MYICNLCDFIIYMYLVYSSCIHARCLVSSICVSVYTHVCMCVYTCVFIFSTHDGDYCVRRGSVNVPVKDIRAGLSVNCWMAQGGRAHPGGSPPHTVLSEPREVVKTGKASSGWQKPSTWTLALAQNGCFQVRSCWLTCRKRLFSMFMSLGLRLCWELCK